MVSFEQYREWATGMVGVAEVPHFENPSFRVNGKIFGTFWVKDHKAMLRLPEAEQSVYCDMKGGIFWAVPGAWGKQGCTFVDLNRVKPTVFHEALKKAYAFRIEKK